MAYTLLLNQLDPLNCDTSSLDLKEPERAEKVINNANLFGVAKFLTPSDILNGDEILNLLFCEEIYRRISGLEPKKDFSIVEKKCFSRIVNNSLGEYQTMKNILPIKPDSDDLFSVLKDGVILCELVNYALPGTIDHRAINSKKPLNCFQTKENVVLGLASAKAIGCNVDRISPLDVAKGRECETLELLNEIFKVNYIYIYIHIYLLSY